MPRIRNFFKTWRLSIRHISYSIFSDKPEAFEVEASIENIEENLAVRKLLERHAEQLKEMRTHVEDMQAIHEKEFDIAIRETNARINELTVFLFDKDELIAFRDEKIQRLKKELVNRLHVFVESEGEAPESEASDQVETRKIKTIVLSNLDEFTEKDKPRVDDWALKIQSKLKKNAHLFSIEDVKIGYVQNLIDEQTLRRLESRFRENAKNPYKTINEIVDNFQRIYDDFNRCLIAINSFRDLRIRENNFTNFWVEFQRLFDDLEYSDDHLLEKFIHKISFALQKHLSMKCDKATDLYDLTNLMRKTIERWRTAENIENKAAWYKVVMNKSNTSEKIAEVKTRSEFKSSSTSAPKVALGASVRLLTLTLARVIRSPNLNLAKKKNMIEDRCFNCNEIGHIAKECIKPKVMKMNEIKKVNSDEKNSKKE